MLNFGGVQVNCFLFKIWQLMVNCWFGARWFGFMGSPYERDRYVGVSLESQPLVEADN